MYTGISELFKNTRLYGACAIDYKNCKWWQFRKKSIIKSAMDWYYPLMVNELKSLTPTHKDKCEELENE